MYKKQDANVRKGDTVTSTSLREIEFMNRIAVIIPAYNEARSLHALLRQLHKDKKVQSIVVDDGSSDQTSAAAKTWGAKVLRNKHNMGTGRSTAHVLQYIKTKKHESVVLMDADGQHDPKYIPLLLHELGKDADYVIASRYIQRSKNATSPLRRLGTKLISLWIALWYGVRVYDVTSGYRAFNKRTLQYLSHHYPTHFSEPEVILNLLENNFIIREIPCQMKPRMFGRSSISAPRAMELMLYIFGKIFWSGLRRRLNTAWVSGR